MIDDRFNEKILIQLPIRYVSQPEDAWGMSVRQTPTLYFIRLRHPDLVLKAFCVKIIFCLKPMVIY